jgi:ubiquinone/menaquinone biosynthesis C-methylase UbiE
VHGDAMRTAVIGPFSSYKQSRHKTFPCIIMNGCLRRSGRRIFGGNSRVHCHPRSRWPNIDPAIRYRPSSAKSVSSSSWQSKTSEATNENRNSFGIFNRISYSSSAAPCSNQDDDDNQIQPPSLKNIQVDEAESTKQLYEDWAQHYENDVRSMGYDMPEQVAQILKDHHVVDALRGENREEYSILDAGCGDGLSGIPLRDAAGEYCDIVGSDIAHAMLDIAQQRGCYDSVAEMDLNKPLSDYENDSLDLVTCVGTMTYVDPNGPCLDEFVRIVKPGGHIVYTNRTDKLESFAAKVICLRDRETVKMIVMSCRHRHFLSVISCLCVRYDIAGIRTGG